MSNPSSLQITDNESAAVQKTPNRVSLQSIEDKIAAEYTFTASEAVASVYHQPEHKDAALTDQTLKILTICIIVMQNGFTVIGKAAPADADNFNAELGRKFAREDAIRQLWPLEGYALRERLQDQSACVKS